MTFSFFKNTQFLWLAFTILCCFSCKGQPNDNQPTNTNQNPIETKNEKTIIVGANQIDSYLSLLKDKKVGIVANQTSMVVDSLTSFFEKPMLHKNDEQKDTYHLVDYLMALQIDVKKVFAPEHGFRGKADAGELVKDGIDTQTGIPILSLYGKNKKPSKDQLDGIDIMIFDIQDVGARFYTYISTLHYIMEACAENDIPLLILDRPNPNGHYIDGPILEPQHSSFVGMHPVPVVHGMTIGEYAKMINGEGWLENKVQCDITIIPVKNYTHQTPYSLPIKPSPNLPNDVAINLYPSLCFFEGTPLSAGRGTSLQFQIFGAPQLPQKYFPFSFTPQANEGAKYPKFKNELCNGKDLRNYKTLDKLNLEWLIESYVSYENKDAYFNNFFIKLAGTSQLQEQIEKGYTYREIRKTWLQGLKEYDAMRKVYLLYE